MEELLNGTMAEAVEKLAKLAAYHRTGPAEKTAAPEWLTSLGETVKNSPGLSHALVGGGLGAAALGANTALNNRGQDPSKKKSILGSMFAGGVAGAGAGAGVGLARQGLSELKNPGGGISGTDALRPGQFTDPATGQRMAIDPQALKDHPELASQVKSLTTPSLQSTIAGGVGGVLQGIRDKVPTTSPWVAGAAGLDLALHNPLFGLARINPAQASGRIGKELFQAGAKGDEAMAPQMRDAILKNSRPGGTMPGGSAATGYTGGTFHELHDLDRGPKNWLQGKVDAVRNKLPRVFGRPNPPGLADIVGGRSTAAGGTRDVLTTHFAPEKEVETVTGKGSGHEVKTKDTQVMPPKRDTLNEGHAGRLKTEGHAAHEGLKGRSLNRLGGFTYAGAKSLPAALGARALLYGAPMGGEYIYRGLQEDAQNHQSMRDIMARYAKPVQGGH